MRDTSKMMKLSKVISFDAFPDFLQTYAENAAQVFEGLYVGKMYKTGLQGHAKHGLYLELLTERQLGFSLFNTGFRFVLNPSFSTEDASEFRLNATVDSSGSYLVSTIGLSPNDFTDSGKLFEVVLMSLNVNDFDLLDIIISKLFNNTPQTFIDHLNSFYTLSPSIFIDDTATSEEIIYSIIQSIENHVQFTSLEDPIDDIISEAIILDDFDSKTSFEKVEIIFSRLNAGDLIEYISSLFIPEIQATIKLSAGLEFPEKILKPVTPEGTVIDDGSVKATLFIGESLIGFHSKFGFILEPQLIVSFPPEYPKAQIGDTGIIIGITGGKIDISENRNIEEATYDGRPNEFKGVYLQEASLSIPWIKDSNGNNLEIQGTNLLMGNPGGISGTIGLGTNLTGKLPGGIAVTLQEFDLVFHQNSITGSSVKLTLTIPGLNDANGDAAELELLGAYATTLNPTTNEQETSFAASISEQNGIALKIGSGFEIVLYEIGMSQTQGGAMILSFVADFKFLSKPAFTGDMLPDAIKVNPIIFETGSGVKSFAIELDWANAENTRLVYENDVLDANIPMDKTILGFITLVAMRATISNHPNGQDKKFRLLVDAGLKIGPVVGSAKDFGIEADLNFRQNKIGESGNNDQPMIDNLSFVPPNGIGLAIEATAVKGAGFLSLDHVNQRYSGALSLTILEKIDLLAYGVLVTKMPDGSKGFSMVAVMSVVFNPTIPLAFGFTLNGLGGLLGLHRSANAEYLRNGLIDGSVGDLMFPVNPAPRLMQIISNLESAFPIHKDRFVFGPAAKIGWGAPSLITIDLALIIELPAPVRLYILGVVRALLPDEKKPILQLQINFLGAIDFAKKSIAFDAALFDSKLLTFKLSGTMAFRMIGGSNPYFLMTVGGFHPSFKIPPLNLPVQQRLSISLVNSGSVYLGATTYFAITSNSVQFGAAIGLSASLGVFAIKGGFGFDVLIIFNPFSFIASMSAGLAISGRLPVFKIRIRRVLKISIRMEWRSVNLASVSLSGTIQGPSEWIVKGKATFSALGTSYTFDVNKQWGKKEQITIPSIDLMPRLLAELNKDINWQIESGKAAKQSVVIREIPEGTFVFNSSGQLQIQQNLLPLKLNIEKYGNGKPKNENRFEITGIKLGNPQRFMQASLVDTKDFFAPGEYKNYSNAQKLSLPAFQKFSNGVKAKAPSAAGAFDYGNYTQHRVMVYEEKYIDTIGDGNDNTAIGENSIKNSLNTNTNAALEAETANLFLKGNAAAKHRRKNNLVQFTKTDHTFTVNEDRYAIVDCRNLKNHVSVGESLWGTLMEAEEAMEILLENNPALSGQITVIAEFEMAA